MTRNDRVDAILALHERGAIQRYGGLREWDATKVAAYASLPAQEASALALVAVGLADEELRKQVLLHLHCFVPGSLASVQGELARRRIVYPGELYWRAGAEARDRLLEQLALRNGMLSVNHILVCLAWVGDEKVQELFSTWRERPPAWAEALHVPPHAYAGEAGWELTPAGQRRDLCSLESVRLEKSADEDAPVRVASSSTMRCPWLDRPLTELLDAPTSLAALRWLRLAGHWFTVITCDQATCFTHIFCELDVAGTATWSTYNEEPDYLGGGECWGPVLPTRMAARQSLATPFWGNPSVWNWSGSKLGGHPSWLQDAEYPRCPKCHRLMPFVGQLDGGDLREHGDGMYFVFACPECRMAATGYQQT